jgi:hypothetical protein
MAVADVARERGLSAGGPGVSPVDRAGAEPRDLDDGRWEVRQPGVLGLRWWCALLNVPDTY